MFDFLCKLITLLKPYGKYELECQYLFLNQRRVLWNLIYEYQSKYIGTYLLLDYTKYIRLKLAYSTYVHIITKLSAFQEIHSHTLFNNNLLLSFLQILSYDALRRFNKKIFVKIVILSISLNHYCNKKLVILLK